MSLNEIQYNDGEPTSGLFETTKKRITQRACDICRRKKIRCDGVQTQRACCSNCKTYNLICTYVEDAKKRGIPKSYVENLEKRAEKLDQLLRQLCQDEALYNQLNASLDGNWIMEHSPVDPSPLVGEIALVAQGKIPQFEMNTPVIRSSAAEVISDKNKSLTDEDDPSSMLAELKKMALKSEDDARFLGMSSEAMLARTAIGAKKEYMSDFGEPMGKRPGIMHQRPEFWTIASWERQSDETPPPAYIFPELDLALHCIDLYFEHENLYMPLLHRPTFDQAVKEGLHLTDKGFAPVFLLVCAVGARYSDDPRVLFDGFDSYHSSGWKWFEQVQTMKRSLISPATLYDLQHYCLSIKFLMGSSPQSCWAMIGVAIQLAQDAGAHRKKAYGNRLTHNEELWKRAFWVLVFLDRTISPLLGRPCCIQDEDFDLDWPVDCDDEYWDEPDPEKCFKQPPNKPSLTTAFILNLKLHQILAHSLRTIYSINPPKILLGFAKQQWQQDLVAELDSALNKWVDSIPDHLRWNPNRNDDNLFNQSVSLYAEYYYIQIIIHRPFIPSPSKPSPLSFPSLAICTNAARSFTHVIHVQRMRNGNNPPHLQKAIFTAGIVLLLGIWGAKRSNLSTDPQKGMSEVHKCMEALKNMEKRWYLAGRVWDVLFELASMGELPLSQLSPPAGTVLEGKSYTPLFASGSKSSLNQNETHGNIAGSFPNGCTLPSQTPWPHQPISTTFPSAGSPQYALPVYSNELGTFSVQSFGGQAHNSQSQTYSPEPGPWGSDGSVMPHGGGAQGGERFEPTPCAGPSEASSSSGPRHSGTSAPRLQQQQQTPRTQAPRSIPMNGFSASGIAMAQGPYGVEPSEMASPMSMMETPSNTQLQTPVYELTPTYFAMTSVESNSTIPHPPPSSGDSLMENVYSGVTNVPTSARGHSYHRHQELEAPRQEESIYPFTVDSNMATIWSNAPAGFELDKWGDYITEMMQDGIRHASGYSDLL